MSYEYVYSPNSSSCQAWKWTENVSGNYENKTPGERGKTPSDLQQTAFSSEELNTVSTDDNNYVEASAAPTLNYTARGAILVKYVISQSEGSVTKLDQLCRAACVVHPTWGETEQRFYLWDFDITSWFDLGDYITQTTKDTHESTVTVDITDYIDSNMIYFLQWDYGGAYYSGGGVCVSPKSPVTLPNGQLKFIKKINIGDRVLGVLNGRLVETETIARTYHKVRKGELLDILTKHGIVSIKPSHDIYTDLGVIPARIVKHFYDLRMPALRPQLFDINLKPVRILDIRISKTRRWEDISTRTQNYFINNILVHNRTKMVL